jgi:hypothetical protein
VLSRPLRTCAGLRMSHRMMLWSLYTTASCAMLLLKEQPTAAGNRCEATSPVQQQQQPASQVIQPLHSHDDAH